MPEALDPWSPSTSSSSPASSATTWSGGSRPRCTRPLVALTNAISGIVLVGALLVAGDPEAGLFTELIGFIAVLLASINVFGGFLVTHRMLSMFKKKK
jgi:H+-translocating NAD(P) transhydrogenase subunit alpha